MKSTKAAFDDFDGSLNLDSTERAAAQERHREITEVLRAAGLIVATFLQGSFARKTMLKPLKDVDMVVLLHPRFAAMLRRPGGAAAAMALLQKEIEQVFAGVQFDLDGKSPHALQVTFADLSFTFDLVPAFADPDSEDIFIADREHDDGRWERSNTRVLNRVISERNQATDGMWVHQVRMLKSFKKNHCALVDTCGLLWEAFAHGAVTKRLEHSEAITRTLAVAARLTMGTVYDPTGIDDLSAEWAPSERSSIIAALKGAARQAEEARRLEQDGEHAGAIEIWHQLIGDPFPGAPVQTAAQALHGLAGGSITSTGRAVTSPRGRQVNRAGRPWRTR
ncbi:SMODS domain-containing nucleotidyltransferase [Actinomadura sp. 3N407]|uniref:SMODS domain-containing nucleotidyltransferase n=1 Tax=Actinomadura sp. 3N407 TaxID=3457423 RepID=UPI003FCC7DCA